MDPASLATLQSTAADLVARLEEFTAAGATGLDEFKALVADLESRIAAAKSGAKFDPRSLFPFILVGLKADRAIVTDPIVNLALGAVIYALGKFAPVPAPVLNPTPAPVPNPPAPLAP